MGRTEPALPHMPHGGIDLAIVVASNIGLALVVGHSHDAHHGRQWRMESLSRLPDGRGEAYLAPFSSRVARRRRTSSPGIISTLPERISLTRCWISSAQAFSTP